MYAKKFTETSREIHDGNTYYRVLPKGVTEKLELSVVRVPPGSKVPAHTHDDHEQAYIILHGSGIMRINDEECVVSAESVVYIPRNSEHEIKNRDTHDDLVYIFVANW